MEIQVKSHTFLEIVYIVISKHKSKKTVKVNRGHPIFPCTITKKVKIRGKKEIISRY